MMYFVAIILSVIAPLTLIAALIVLLEKIKHRWLTRILQFSLASLCISSPTLVFVLFGFLSFEAASYCILALGFILLLALFANGGHLTESFVSTLIVAVLIPNIPVVVHAAREKRRSQQQSVETHQQDATCTDRDSATENRQH
ncbi:MAG: hypothetical protein U0996_09520 [Planctomycetaceae bacterium]